MLNKDSPAKRETELISFLDETIISTKRTDEHSQMRRIIEKAKIATREHQFWRRTQKVVWESLHCVLVEHKPKSVKKIKIIDKFRKTRVKAAEVWNWQHHAKLHASRTWAVAGVTAEADTLTSLSRFCHNAKSCRCQKLLTFGFPGQLFPCYGPGSVCTECNNQRRAKIMRGP